MSNEDPVLRRISVYVCANCIAGVVGQCHVPGCLFIRFNIKDTLQPLKYLIHQPRVFWNGEDVPGGVCVLRDTSEVGYLDETGDCSCEDVDPVLAADREARAVSEGRR